MSTRKPIAKRHSKNPLTNAREMRDLSLYALAKAAGITYSHLQSIEAGSRPRVDLAIRLARLLEVPVEELFAESVDLVERAS